MTISVHDYLSLIFTSLSTVIAFFSMMIAITALCVSKEIATRTEKLQKQQFYVQQWAALMTEYRSHEFGEAINAVCDFYITRCNRNIDCVEQKYKCRYEIDKRNIFYQKKSWKDTLHFKRRLLAQYYFQLWKLIQDSNFSNASMIEKFFHKNELNIIAIVYKMNEAASDRKIFKPLVENSDSKADNQIITDDLALLYDYFKKLYKPNDDDVIPLK